jgi:RpiR family transcriptional regulator, carbohydrate utilization regulator
LEYGKKCDYPRSCHELKLRLGTYTTDDVILVVDGEGNDDTLNEILRQAGENGVKVLAVTENRMSKLAILGDEAICYSHGAVQKSEYSYSTTIAQHYMLDLLIQQMIKEQYGSEDTDISLS